MSLFEGRGGIPHIFRATITTTGREHDFRCISKEIYLRVNTAPCRIFFTEDDFDNNKNYIEVPVPSASTPDNNYHWPIQADKLWLKGVGASSVIELVVIRRLN